MLILSEFNQNHHHSRVKLLAKYIRRGSSVQRGLVLAAHAAAKSKHNYLRAMYHRLSARRGKARAAVAVGRTILQAAYFMLKRGEEYYDLSENYLDQLDRTHTTKQLVKRLQALGYIVTLEETIPVVGASQPYVGVNPLPLATRGTSSHIFIIGETT
jgi:hypothetical protein